MKTSIKRGFLLFFVVVNTHFCFSQITYDYYKNPDKIGSSNPRATEYFIKSFEFIMQWGKEETDSAIFYMQKAIEEDSTYAIAYATLGHLIKYRGYNGTTIDVDSIARLAEKALQLNPKTGDAQTLMSWVYYMKNDMLNAIECCKRAVEAEPDHRETWFWLGVRYSHVPEKIDSAIYAFGKSLEVDTLFGQPHQKLGWIYLEKSDYQNAANHFRKMIHLYEDIEPRDERMLIGYYGLGVTLLADKKYDEAICTLNILFKKCDSTSLVWSDNLSSRTYSALIVCYLGKANSELNNFIAANLNMQVKYPHDIGITQNIIENIDEISYSLKDFNLLDTLNQVKLPLYDKVFNNATEDYIISSAINSKLISFQDKKNYDAAIEELTILLKKYPDRKEVKSTIYYSIACNYALKGETNKAIKNLKLSIEEGFNDFNWMKNDPDFDKIRDDPKFKNLYETKVN